MCKNYGWMPLLALTLAGGFTAQAQKTIVLKQDADHPQTVVEAERGFVIVNGDTVVRPGETAHRKIVIDRETDAPGTGNFSPFGGPGKASAPKARLGVLADPEKSKGGAYIREVQPGSPAQAAGLQAGDKITSIDGQSVGSAPELVEVIGAYAPDDTVKIAYERSGKKRTTTAYLEGAPQESRRMPGGGIFGIPGEGFGGDLSRIFGDGGLFGSRDSDAETPKIGVSVEERMDGNGVEALSVTSGSAAEKAGLRKGDVITRLGATKIDSPRTLLDAIRRQQGAEVTVHYMRSGKALTGKITIPKNLQKMDM